MATRRRGLRSGALPREQTGHLRRAPSGRSRDNRPQAGESLARRGGRGSARGRDGAHSDQPSPLCRVRRTRADSRRRRRRGRLRGTAGRGGRCSGDRSCKPTTSRAPGSTGCDSGGRLPRPRCAGDRAAARRPRVRCRRGFRRRHVPRHLPSIREADALQSSTCRATSTLRSTGTSPCTGYCSTALTAVCSTSYASRSKPVGSGPSSAPCFRSSGAAEAHRLLEAGHVQGKLVHRNRTELRAIGAEPPGGRHHDTSGLLIRVPEKWPCPDPAPPSLVPNHSRHVH